MGGSRNTLDGIQWLQGDDTVVHEELNSDEGSSYIYYGPVTLTSTTNSSSNVYAAAALFTIKVAAPGDILIISGSTAADGTYTIDIITDDENIIIVESIPDSTGGTVELRYRAGENEIGIEATRLLNLHLSANTIKSVINNINAFLCTPGISWTDIDRSSGLVSQTDIWQDVGRTKRFKKSEVTRSGGLVSQLVHTYYKQDGVTVLGTETCDIIRTSNQVTSIESTYSGFTDL